MWNYFYSWSWIFTWLWFIWINHICTSSVMWLYLLCSLWVWHVWGGLLVCWCWCWCLFGLWVSALIRVAEALSGVRFTVNRDCLREATAGWATRSALEPNPTSTGFASTRTVCCRVWKEESGQRCVCAANQAKLWEYIPYKMSPQPVWGPP